MNNIVLDGKALAVKIRTNIKEEVAVLKEKYGLVPGLAVVLVGNDPASEIYVRNKEKACSEVGFYSRKITLPEDTMENELIGIIHELNNDPLITGILVQLPLPAHINKDKILNCIAVEKDVDVFKPENIGRVFEGTHRIAPCTPSGIMALLDEYNIDVEGKHCVVVGRSNIVGKPQVMLMLHRNATVTICHSKTSNLAEECRRADILVCAVGKSGLVTPDMVKDGVVIVDAAMNRDGNGKLCGDCCRETYEKAACYTPVPGGVGPMTIAMLMQNTFTLFRDRYGV